MDLALLGTEPLNLMELCPKASPSKSQKGIERLVSWQISGKVKLAMVWNIGNRDQKSCNPYSSKDPNEPLKTKVELHISSKPNNINNCHFKYFHQVDNLPNSSGCRSDFSQGPPWFIPSWFLRLGPGVSGAQLRCFLFYDPVERAPSQLFQFQ